MTVTTHGGSAKIYEFPRGGRAGLTSRREDLTSATVPAVPRFADAAFGGSWYHEEAVRDAERPKKS
jgi:hypothetical protein